MRAYGTLSFVRVPPGGSIAVRLDEFRKISEFCQNPTILLESCRLLIFVIREYPKNVQPMKITKKFVVQVIVL